MGGETVGRAYTVLSNGEVFLDRIYYKKNLHKEMIIKLAHKKGWYTKITNSYDCNEYKNKDGVRRTPFDVEVDFSNIDEYPFIDTFCFSDKSSYLSCKSGEYKFQCTDGSFSYNEDEDEDDRDGMTLCEDGEWYNDEDVYRVDFGSREGEYYHCDDVVEIQSGHNTGWVHENDAEYNENLGEYIYTGRL